MGKKAEGVKEWRCSENIIEHFSAHSRKKEGRFPESGNPGEHKSLRSRYWTRGIRVKIFH
ncbi:MAG: hypothetical protein PHP71_06930 [Methanosarcina sp.]|jgi:hypothetical protein|nr:hypothetical protein [Methanosarcina sp.]